MKRILQSVALALAAFLVANPALATMTCAEQTCADGRSSPDCCLPMNDAPMHGMAMPSMSASGQAPPSTTLTEAHCASAPCCAVSVRPTLQLAAPVKFSVEKVVSSTWLGVLPTLAAPTQVDTSPGDAATPARALHVLFQVFRI